MAERRQPPAPRAWFDQDQGGWRKWFERLTRNILIAGRVDVVLDPSSVSANTTDEQSFSVGGVVSGDKITVIKPSHTTGLGIFNARSDGNDTVKIQFMNVTGSTIDPPSETYRIYYERWNEQ